MNTEYFIRHNSSQRHAVEEVDKCLPKLDTKSKFALVTKSIDAIYRGTLVVSTNEKEVLGVLELVTENKSHGLEGLLSAINVIAEEEVI